MILRTFPYVLFKKFIHRPMQNFKAVNAQWVGQICSDEGSICLGELPARNPSV